MHDVGGAWITPGLIDCHTHLVFAGTRAGEYADACAGALTPKSRARVAGSATCGRCAPRRYNNCSMKAPRSSQGSSAEGVTTVEIKSGYGLTLADEAKMFGWRARWGMPIL